MVNAMGMFRCFGCGFLLGVGVGYRLVFVFSVLCLRALFFNVMYVHLC